MSEVRRIWWVRHGPTHEKAFTGWRDVPADLSDTDQLARLASYLPEEAVVVSSDLKRASATADAIAGLRQRLGHARDLREMDFGEWDGKHFSQVSKTHPELSYAFWDNPGDIRAPNGESWNDTASRVSTAADKLLALTSTDIIAVAHFGAILTQVQRAWGVSAQKVISQKIDNLSVTCLVFDGIWRAELVNHCP